MLLAAPGARAADEATLPVPAATPPAPATANAPEAHALAAAPAVTFRARQELLSAKATSYLWDQRLDAESGKIGKTQVRFLQALAVLALAADGRDRDPRYRERLLKVAAELREPINDLARESGPPRKVFVGTSREALAFESHVVVALAYEQLAAMELGDLKLNETFLRGAESAIEYLLDYRKRGREYATAGGWPLNAYPYNRDRPDRRVTAWALTLLQTHQDQGGRVNAAALEEAPNFVFAAQRLAPALTPRLQTAEAVYREWLPKVRRGQTPTGEPLDQFNEYREYTRQLEEAGGFGLDRIGIVSADATALGLYCLGLFDHPDRERRVAAAAVLGRLPLNWEAQRFFMAQFFATRALRLHAGKYHTPDYETYLNRLLTLLEQQQAADGSFPLGSRGVEELTQMERIYTTAMCVLIVTADRGTLVFDRPPTR